MSVQAVLKDANAKVDFYLSAFRRYNSVYRNRMHAWQQGAYAAEIYFANQHDNAYQSGDDSHWEWQRGFDMRRRVLAGTIAAAAEGRECGRREMQAEVDRLRCIIYDAMHFADGPVLGLLKESGIDASGDCPVCDSTEDET